MEKEVPKSWSKLFFQLFVLITWYLQILPTLSNCIRCLASQPKCKLPPPLPPILSVCFHDHITEYKDRHWDESQSRIYWVETTQYTQDNLDQNAWAPKLKSHKDNCQKWIISTQWWCYRYTTWTDVFFFLLVIDIADNKIDLNFSYKGNWIEEIPFVNNL